jgi:chitin disaccharide deacetylase
MSTAPAWVEAAARLRAHGAGRVEAGLHLNLTEPCAERQWRRGLSGLMLSAGGRWLPARRLREEIAAQLDAFEQHADGPPSFVDGHQHVHQLPQVREALLEELQRRYPAHRTWLRDTRAPKGCRDGAAVKPRLVGALGAAGLAALARRMGFMQNHGMLGVYGFGGTAQGYANRLQRWCADLPEGGLLICHAASHAPPGDPIGTARAREFAVLAGLGFGRLLQEQRLSVGRLSDHLSTRRSECHSSRR